MGTRKITTDWFSAANDLIDDSTDGGRLGDAYLALFAKLFRVPENDKVYRELKRKLGIPVDETVLMVVEEDITPPVEDRLVITPIKTGVIQSKVVMGRDVALRQAYEYYNQSHMAFELDCNPEDVFRKAMELDGEVLAEVGSMELGASPRKLRYRLLPVRAISKEVEPFEHEMEPEEPLPRKKWLKKGKPSKPKPEKTEADEEAEDWLDEDEPEIDEDSELEQENENDDEP
jgi:hypothetical protein